MQVFLSTGKKNLFRVWGIKRVSNPAKICVKEGEKTAISSHSSDLPPAQEVEGGGGGVGRRTASNVPFIREYSLPVRNK